MRDFILHLLPEWNEQYFRHLDPGLFHELQADAEAKRKLIDVMPAHKVVETAANGLYLEASEEPGKVILVPQYHSSPANLIDRFQGVTTCLYVSDFFENKAGNPPALCFV